MKSFVFILVGLGIGALIAVLVLKPSLITQYLPSKYKDSLPLTKEAINSIPSSEPSSIPAAPSTTIEAGGKLSFVKYQVTIPNTWTHQASSQTATDETLVIANGQNKITIAQAASEGSVCVYPGDPDPGIPFKSEFKYFNAITTADGTLLRRSGDSANSTTFTLCAFSQPNDNYQLPTQYGYITTNFPLDPNSLKQVELDSIISSLKKI